MSAPIPAAQVRDDELGLGRRRARLDTALTAVLLLVVCVLVNRLVARHLRWRQDLSQDQLYTLSPATREILSQPFGAISARCFFTGEVRSGAVALGKARVEALLDELVHVSGGRILLDVVDPAADSLALAQAQDYGIPARDFESLQGTTRVIESVYLGLVLRHQGREEVLPFVTARTLEVELVSAVHRLQQELRPVVGWLDPGPRPGAPGSERGTFELARALLARRFELVSVERLEQGGSIPADVEVLVAVRPQLGEGSARALDRFARRGGRLLLCVEELLVNAASQVEPLSSGTDQLLRGWGAPVTPEHVWDHERAVSIPVPRPARGGGQAGRSIVEYPLFLQLTRGDLSDDVSATAGLDGALLFWPHPIAPLEAPAGVTRHDLITSSDEAYRVGALASITLDPDVLRANTNSLFAQGKGRAYTLCVGLEGRLPSPFEAGGTPVETRAVILGDADWLRDGYIQPPNAALLENLVDWLVADEALMALRTRTPRDRSLVDLEGRERRRLGLAHEGSAETLSEVERIRALEQEARDAARLARWRAMLTPTAVSLALLAALTAGWALVAGRPVVPEPRERRA